MATAKFFIEKRRDKTTGKIKTENVPIRLVFSFNGLSLTLTTGEKINAKHWDQKSQRVRKTARGSVEINDILLKCADDIQKAYREFRLDGITPTSSLLLKRMKDGKKQNEIKPGVFHTFNEYLIAKQNSFAPSFHRMMRRAKRYLSEFASDDISFSDIDLNFMENYSSYLTKKGLTVNSVAGEIKRLKMFLHHANKNGDSDNLKYKGFIAKTHEPEIFYLSMDELHHLHNLKIDDERLERVRDVFIFGCYTALRYSDIARLRKHEVKDGFIRFTQVKTREENSVPLVSISKEVLEKYKCLPGPLALPVISSQKMNDYLKELGELAEFNESVTVIRYIGTKRIEHTYKKWEIMSTHMMRRTFISNSLIMQIPESEVMAISGHRSYQSFKRYFKVRDAQKTSAMKKWESITS